MAKEGNTALNPWRELFSVGVYKRSQGRLARQLTFASIVVLVGFGCWALHNYLTTRAPSGVRYGVPLVLLLVGMWLGFRLVNMPRFADFLIGVEGEMNKVSWPTRTELVRSVIVVLVTIVGLAFVLYLYDILWQLLLRFLEVLH